MIWLVLGLFVVCFVLVVIIRAMSDRIETLEYDLDQFDQVYRHVAGDEQKGNTMSTPTTETGKAQEVQAAYESLKAVVVADAATIAQLQQQIANGTPVTQDQLGALGILDALDTEVEAD